MKVLKAPATAFDIPATSDGLKFRTWPGQGPSLGPVVTTMSGFERCGARLAFQGMKSESAW